MQHMINVRLNFYSGSHYVTWGARSESGAPIVSAGAPLPPHGKALGKLGGSDLKAVIERGLKLYSTCHIIIS